MENEQSTSRYSKAGFVIVVLLLIAFGAAGMFHVIRDNEKNEQMQAVNAGIDLQFNQEGIETIEYGSKVDPADLVRTYKGKLKVPKIDTMTVGIQDLVYTISSEGYSKDFIKTVSIVDTQKPVIKVKGDTKYTIRAGQALGFSEDDVTASDPVDGQLKVESYGNVNTNRAGRYIKTFRATDANGNTSVRRVRIVVLPSGGEKKAFDYSVGEKLDSWTQYSSGEIIVRGKEIATYGILNQSMIDQYIFQLNSCPKYLFDQVDSWTIMPQEMMEGQYNIKNTKDNITVGHTVAAEGNAKVVLNGDVLTKDQTTVIHEAAHAYDFKTGISRTKAFQKLYKEESKNAEKDAQKSISEYFAYTYTTYVTEGKDVLAQTCPKTAEFYEDNQL